MTKVGPGTLQVHWAPVHESPGIDVPHVRSTLQPVVIDWIDDCTERVSQGLPPAAPRATSEGV